MEIPISKDPIPVTQASQETAHDASTLTTIAQVETPAAAITNFPGHPVEEEKPVEDQKFLPGTSLQANPKGEDNSPEKRKKIFTWIHDETIQRQMVEHMAIQNGNDQIQVNQARQVIAPPAPTNVHAQSSGLLDGNDNSQPLNGIGSDIKMLIGVRSNDNNWEEYYPPDIINTLNQSEDFDFDISEIQLEPTDPTFLAATTSQNEKLPENEPKQEQTSAEFIREIMDDIPNPFSKNLGEQ
jgi:hypothetical protein